MNPLDGARRYVPVSEPVDADLPDQLHVMPIVRIDIVPEVGLMPEQGFMDLLIGAVGLDNRLTAHDIGQNHWPILSLNGLLANARDRTIEEPGS